VDAAGQRLGLAWQIPASPGLHGDCTVPSTSPSVEALAAALRGLSPEERARLAALLIGEQAEEMDG
jgi:hypothetical protein